jgi:dTDP-4-dehydrorhamnose 3,5-epimerase-like enzyme
MLATVDDLSVTAAHRIVDARGALTVLDWAKFAPFDIVRFFWLSDVPVGASRGAHGHKECRQYIVCMTGEIGIDAFDGERTRHFDLSAGEGFNLPIGIFIDLKFGAPGAVVLVLCDQPYDPAEYLHSREELVAFRAKMKKGQ